MTEEERARWNKATDEQLIHEYRDMMRACYGMFSNNDKYYSDELADILLARGVTHIPNIFGDIEIKRWHEKAPAMPQIV